MEYLDSSVTEDRFRKGVPAEVTTQEKENLRFPFSTHPLLDCTRTTLAIKIFLHRPPFDIRDDDDNVCVPIFIRDNFHPKK